MAAIRRSSSVRPARHTELDPHLPCIVGTARRTWHPSGAPAPEPLEMWAEVARAAADDVGARVDPLALVDDLGVVHCQSWAYDDPAGRAADRLGLPHARRHASILAGTSPQRLLDAAAARMLRGEAQVALVVGGEALWTRRMLQRAGETPRWSHPHPTPPTLPVDLDEWYLPTELAHGVLPAWLTFALLEQARWAAAPDRRAERRRFARTMGRLNEVAVENPDAWFHHRATGSEITAPAADNRMVATPFTKQSTAFMDVDMAAANLMVTRQVADAWGVPEDRRTYLRGWGFARDAVHLAAREDLASSPAMRTATARALATAGLHVDEVDLFDLYSCFGSAVHFAQDALGLAPDDPRPISVTGGLPYHGGPSSNYMGHAISHLVDHLRDDPEQVAMATGIGMHMTKHVAALWSGRPGPLLDPEEASDQRWEGDLPTDRPVLDHHDGEVRVLAATVVHAADGRPDHVVAIGELDDGSRCYARTADAEVVDAVATDAWPDQRWRVDPGAHGTNRLRLAARRARTMASVA